MEIEENDKVRITGGPCTATKERYSLAEAMKQYMYTDDLYNVDRVLKADGQVFAVRIKTYTWHIDDITLVKKSDGTIVNDDLDIPEPVKSRSDFFKFDDSSIKSIIA
jgi:hypothetical protein